VGVTAGVVLVTMPVFVELSLGVAAEELGVPVPVPVLGVLDAELVSTRMLDDEEGVSKLRLEGVVEPELPTDVLGVAVEETLGVSVLALEGVLPVAELGRCTHFFAATAWKAPASARAANPTVERIVGFVQIDRKRRIDLGGLEFVNGHQRSAVETAARLALIYWLLRPILPLPTIATSGLIVGIDASMPLS
jgi:hypothetical protein